jgi:uncharacterized phiE125 gp8 family phage protein
MTTAANDLTTVAAVQSYLGIPNTQDATLIQSLVTAASTLIQSLLGYQVASGTYTETRHGHGKESLVFGNTPVTAVSSVIVCGNAIAPATSWGQAGYLFDETALYLSGGLRFDRGFRNIQLAYTAGYAAVPADLAQACNELVGLRYGQRLRQDFVSQTLDGQVTAFSQKDMPASVATALEPYKRRFTIV